MENNRAKRTSADEVAELLVVILLGITALLTAWATWIGSLHGGNQATNYTQSNNIASEGNSEYNAGVQMYMQDMILYNDLNNLSIDLHFAEEAGDRDEVDRLEWKMDELLTANATDDFIDAYNWAVDESNATGESVSPFENEAFVDSYFVTANELLGESEALLEQGKEDNKNGDSFGLVTVIYSVVLFLLGINGSFNNRRNKFAVLGIAGVAFLAATIYMLTLPMPTGFSLSTFFGG